MDDCGMADGDIVAKQCGEIIGEMDDGVVLDVGMVADNDAVDVATDDRVVPNTGIVSESDVTQNGGAARNAANAVASASRMPTSPSSRSRTALQALRPAGGKSEITRGAGVVLVCDVNCPRRCVRKTPFVISASEKNPPTPLVGEASRRMIPAS